MLGFGDPLIGTGLSAGSAGGAAINCGAVTLAALRSAPPMTGFLADAPANGGLVLADIDFLASLPRLPDSACELQAIANRFAAPNTKVHLGAEATETRLKSLNDSGELAAYDVLVFATHGLTAGEAGAISPGLVLTPPTTASARDDGLLSAAEIAGLDLNAELVVLCACNTAAGDTGDEDGLSGLALAFFRAGAKSLLVTHWSVHSEAAVDVSTGLFSALETDQTGQFSAALRDATLDILADTTRPAFHHHPSCWAAFSIIGAT
ncbi:MAG: CHAT domain-containing protein [Paracoccaceae bacterium]|jgi:CHAT domain-containing protein